MFYGVTNIGPDSSPCHRSSAFLADALLARHAIFARRANRASARKAIAAWSMDDDDDDDDDDNDDKPT